MPEKIHNDGDNILRSINEFYTKTIFMGNEYIMTMLYFMNNAMILKFEFHE